MPDDRNEILSGIKRKDSKSFDLLFEQYYKKLSNYVNSIIHDPSEAEDIVQNLFADIWLNAEHIHITVSFSSYLFRSCYNAALDYLKHSKVQERYRSAHSRQQEITFAESLEFQELLEVIEDCINDLPDQCRKIFRLSREEGLRYSAISKKLNITENTVDTQIRRALKKIREVLQARFPLF